MMWEGYITCDISLYPVTASEKQVYLHNFEVYYQKNERKNLKAQKHIRIDDELLGDIEKIAKEENTSATKVINDALKYYRDFYYMQNKSTMINQDKIQKFEENFFSPMKNNSTAMQNVIVKLAGEYEPFEPINQATNEKKLIVGAEFEIDVTTEEATKEENSTWEMPIHSEIHSCLGENSGEIKNEIALLENINGLPYDEKMKEIIEILGSVKSKISSEKLLKLEDELHAKVLDDLSETVPIELRHIVKDKFNHFIKSNNTAITSNFIIYMSLAEN